VQRWGVDVRGERGGRVGEDEMDRDRSGQDAAGHRSMRLLYLALGLFGFWLALMLAIVIIWWLA
jgi:hypothetical protein